MSTAGPADCCRTPAARACANASRRACSAIKRCARPMRHLFSTEGEQALEAVMRQRPLLAFDFDGTLAPIVARPDEAHVPLEVSHGLAELAQALPVAVITGRSVADVRPRLGFEPRYVVGNHGAEDL